MMYHLATSCILAVVLMCSPSYSLTEQGKGEAASPTSSSAAAAAPSDPHALLTALDHAFHASGSQSTTYTIPPGSVYNFQKLDLNLTNIRNGVLHASDVTFIFYPGYGVAIDSCDNFSFVGGVVAYDPPCFSQGVITNVDAVASTFRLKVDDGFPLPDRDKVPFFNVSETKAVYWEQVGDTYEMVKDQGMVSPVTSVRQSSGVSIVECLRMMMTELGK